MKDFFEDLNENADENEPSFDLNHFRKWLSTQKKQEKLEKLQESNEDKKSVKEEFDQRIADKKKKRKKKE